MEIILLLFYLIYIINKCQNKTIVVDVHKLMKTYT